MQEAARSDSVSRICSRGLGCVAPGTLPSVPGTDGSGEIACSPSHIIPASDLGRPADAINPLPEVVTPLPCPVMPCQESLPNHTSRDACVSADDTLETPAIGYIDWCGPTAKRPEAALEMPPIGPGHDICTAAPVRTFEPLEALGFNDLLMRQTSCFGPELLLAVFMQLASLGPSTASRSTYSRPSIASGNNEPPLPSSGGTAGPRSLPCPQDHRVSNQL